MNSKNNNLIHKDNIIIIARAAGEIGTEYCKKAISQQIDCIGIIRTKKTNIRSKYFRELTCNLDDENQIAKVFSRIDFKKYKQVIYLHTIGVDKLDPRGFPHVKPMNTIDSNVYNTNVNSFKYLLRFCFNKLVQINNKRNGDNIKFRVAIIAGVADKHAPFVIESFCEAKFILRQYIQSCINLYPKWVSGLSINVSSTITESALKVRPYADTEYWLTPKNVVDKSFKRLVSKTSSYKEMDIIKHYPNFVSNYYENIELLYKKWSQETGIIYTYDSYYIFS